MGRPMPCLRRTEDKFAVMPAENVWHCRGSGKGGGAIDLEMHLSGGSFVDAVRALIGEDAGTPQRRQPTPEEIAARERERRNGDEPKPKSGRARR